MPTKNKTLSLLELTVGIDRTSYTKSKNMLRAMGEDLGKFNFDERQLKGFADQIRSTIGAAGKDVSLDLIKRFDEANIVVLKNFSEVGEALKKIEKAEVGGGKELQWVVDDIAAQFGLELGAGADVIKEALAEQQAYLKDQLAVEQEAHKLRVDSAKKLAKALKPDLKKFKDGSEALGSGFMDILNSAKSGDVKGLVGALAGGGAKIAEKGAGLADMGKAAAATEKTATTLGLVAGGLSVAAISIAAIGGALALVVGLLVMADEQAKEFNTTLLDGAGSADFAFTSASTVAGEMEGVLESASQAAINMAREWRGQAKDYTSMVGALNQAGLTYKEMLRGTNSQAEAQERLQGYMKATLVGSKSLGLTVSETTEAMGQWSSDFGLDQAKMEERFVAIAAAAQVTGMNTKRFFTAVSQATAGMAIYNIRMEEAAFLLARTSKILGDTDASDFIKSLTKGFSDESITDRIKRTMIAGSEDTRRIFAASAERTAKDFVSNFAGSGTRDALNKAFQSVGLKADIIGDPSALAAEFSKKTAKEQRQVIHELRQINTDGANAAARQLEVLKDQVQGAQGGLNAQVKGLGALDMTAKLAMKLQTLGDTRLADMGVAELAAFEQYAGVSGEGLKQLMLVESDLMGQFEALERQAETGDLTAKRTIEAGFEAFIANNAEQFKDVATTAMTAEQMARSTMENTQSIIDVLKANIADVLFNFYHFFVSSSTDQAALQREAMADTAKAQENNKILQKEQAAKLGEAEKALAEMESKAKGAGKRGVTTEELAAIEAQKKKVRETIREAAELKSFGDELAKRQEDLKSGTIKAKAGGAAADEVPMSMRKGGARTGMVDFSKEVAAAFDEGGESVDISNQSLGVNTEMLDMLYGQSDTSDDMLSESEKEAKLEKKWRDSGYEKKSKDANLDSLKAYEGWKAGTAAGLQGAELDKAIADFAAGNWDVLEKKGIRRPDVGGAGGGGGGAAGGGFGMAPEGFHYDANGNVVPDAPPPGPGGGDFIMRPGQGMQKFSSADTIMGFKPGGPLAGGGGGPANINITINGGNQSEVYNTVKSALKNSGLRP